jgi:outer membrane protein
MRSLRFLVLLAAAPFVAGAQQASSTPRGTLTLDEAIQLAKENNPAYRRAENTLRSSDAQVRSTYGQLLPQASANFSAGYQQGGTQIFQGFEQKGPDTYSTAYNVNLQYGLSAGALFAPKAVKASRDATIANIGGASAIVRGGVTQAYITALQSAAQAALQDTLMQTAKAQLDLANARFTAGAATILDVRNAEVAVGQSQVNSLNAHNTARVDKVRLGQVIGVLVAPDARLTTTFAVTTPSFSLDSLISLGQQVNPSVLAAKATSFAADMNVRIAKMQYTPSLGLSTGIGGQSLDHATLPFNYTKRPYSVSAYVSLPLFNGFSRETQVENARVQQENATLDVRERELQMTADITQAYGTLMTAAQTVQLQEKNAETARQALEFAQERYRVGAANFFELTQARGQAEQAQIGRVDAVYNYQKAFAGLEQAVGRPLR